MFELLAHFVKHPKMTGRRKPNQAFPDAQPAAMHRSNTQPLPSTRHHNVPQLQQPTTAPGQNSFSRRMIKKLNAVTKIDTTITSPPTHQHDQTGEHVQSPGEDAKSPTQGLQRRNAVRVTPIAARARSASLPFTSGQQTSTPQPFRKAASHQITRKPVPQHPKDEESDTPGSMKAASISDAEEAQLTILPDHNLHMMPCEEFENNESENDVVRVCRGPERRAKLIVPEEVHESQS